MYNHHVSHYIFEQGEAEFAYLTPFFNNFYFSSNFDVFFLNMNIIIFLKIIEH
jgi:hypothetical protein